MLDFRRACEVYAPAIAIPIIFVLLYLFEPGVKELPWTTLRIAGAILGGYRVCTSGYGAACSWENHLPCTPKAKGLVTHGLYSRIQPYVHFVDLMFFGIILVLEWRWP